MATKGRQFRSAGRETEPLVVHVGDVRFEFPAAWSGRTYLEFLLRREERRLSMEWLFEAVFADELDRVLDELQRDEIDDVYEAMLAFYTGYITRDEFDSGDYDLTATLPGKALLAAARRGSTSPSTGTRSEPTAGESTEGTPTK